MAARSSYWVRLTPIVRKPDGSLDHDAMQRGSERSGPFRDRAEAERAAAGALASGVFIKAEISQP